MPKDGLEVRFGVHPGPRRRGPRPDRARGAQRDGRRRSGGGRLRGLGSRLRASRRAARCSARPDGRARTEAWVPPDIELPEEAPGAGDPELEERAAADLTPQLEGILFAMYRHELIAEAEDADDHPGPGSRTLLRSRRRSPTTSWRCWGDRDRGRERAGQAAMAGDAHPGRTAAGPPDCQAAARPPD